MAFRIAKRDYWQKLVKYQAQAGRGADGHHQGNDIGEHESGDDEAVSPGTRSNAALKFLFSRPNLLS